MNDLAKWDVHGAVETLRTEHVEWDLTLEQWKAAEYYGLVRFDADGRIVESESHNRDGSISGCRYIYDAAGRLQELQSEAIGGPTGTSIYGYDESGRLLRIANVDADGTEHESETYSYGPDGKTTKTYFLPKLEPNVGFAYAIDTTEQSYSATGARSTATRYNGRGQPDEALFYDGEHRLLRRVTFTRDSAGRLISEDSYLGEALPFPDGVKELENAPEEVREAATAAFASLFGAGKVISSTTYSYDEKDRRVERRLRMSELGDHRVTYVYDDRDRVIEETCEDTSRRMQIGEEGTLQTMEETSHTQHLRFEYQEDVQGNWTEKIVWIRQEPNFERSNATRRAITYYPG
ncbi:MAG: hypothetical protein ABSC93_19555 [Bryobacteraceae bacterium]|jgi:hypothetical protein